MQCFLYSVPTDAPPNSGRDVTALPDPNNPGRVIRRLMGTLALSPFVGIDPESRRDALLDARVGTYYIFHDLSCRQPGFYRLRFSLTAVDQNLAAPVAASPRTGFTPTQVRSQILASAISDTFEVFGAKDFPGMKPSTALARELKRQGATVAVKKGSEGRNIRRRPGGGGGETSRAEGEVEGSGSGGSDDGGPGPSSTAATAGSGTAP